MGIFLYILRWGSNHANVAPFSAPMAVKCALVTWYFSAKSSNPETASREYSGFALPPRVVQIRQKIGSRGGPRAARLSAAGTAPKSLDPPLARADSRGRRRTPWYSA